MPGDVDIRGMLAQELEYIYKLSRLGTNPGLEVMERLMVQLGNPERGGRYVHITGTNGKGSVASMIDSVMRAAGYKVGLYTSPHLYEFNERIRINGAAIPEEDLLRLIQQVRQAADQAGLTPTFFEFTTALTFLYFATKAIDLAVIEVGLGGRWDATNVITPLVSVITNVGLDHMELLGPTKVKIAGEKAGIIKEKVPTVLGRMEREVLDVFKKVCRQKNSRLTMAEQVVAADVLDSSLDGQRVELKGVLAGIVDLPLLGRHQVDNLSVAVAAIDRLAHAGYLVDFNQLAAGIRRTTWEGRLDIVSRQPLIIVDGAHNADGLQALADFLSSLPATRGADMRYDVLVLGVKRGRDLTDIATKILPLFKQVIVTEGAYQPERAAVLAEKLNGWHKSIQAVRRPGAAVAAAKKLLPPHGVMVVTGSLYMIADALAALNRQKIKTI